MPSNPLRALSVRESLFDSTSHGNEDRPVIVQGSAGEIVRKKTNLCKRPPLFNASEELLARIGSFASVINSRKLALKRGVAKGYSS